MRIKKLIIITILISSTAMLFGCDSTKTNESSNNSNETKITSDAANDNTNSNIEDNKITDDSNSNSQNSKTTDNNKSNSNSNNDTNKNVTNKDSNINSNNNKNTTDNNSTSKTKETISKNNVYKKSNETTNDDNLTYKSKLGLSMKFPSSWKDKYRIKEDDKGLYVYFKSKDPTTPENEGLIFLIEKTYDSTEPGMLDSIGGKKYITVNNRTYLIGGPTDIGLSSENAEFDKYTSMRNECEKVIDTVTSSN